MPTSRSPLTVGILIFNNVEVLDYCGPFEVFSVANEDETLFQVCLIAPDSGLVETCGGMMVQPQYTYETCPKQLDILLVPGGNGTRPLMQHGPTLDFVKRHAKHTATIVASVCTGSLILARVGLLKDKTVTTHWQALDLLQETCPSCKVDRSKHWIQDGSVWTSAGISAGIDMALKLVEHCYDSDTAQATAKMMEYPFPESDERRISIDERIE